MEFDLPYPLLQSAELWRFATRKAICCAINLQNNILFGLLLMDASRNWKPWGHDTSVSVHVEDVFFLSLHVYACDRMNLKHCLLHALHRNHYFKKGLKAKASPALDTEGYYTYGRVNNRTNTDPSFGISSSLLRIYSNIDKKPQTSEHMSWIAHPAQYAHCV